MATPAPSPYNLPLATALSRSEPLGALLKRVRESRARFDTIAPLLPAALAAAVKPGPLDDSTWVLLAAHASAAAKLRQMVRKRRRFFTAEEIEDLVQEILLSVHAVRATFDPKRPFLPWLSTIAHNRLIDSARRYYRGKSHEIQMDELPVTFADAWTNVEGEEYRDPEELSIAIRSLPEGQREAIEMVKLREMSLKEAAAASGTTVGALKVSIHRAVLNLRKALNRE